MFNNFKLAIPLVGLFLISACGDSSDIKKVKNHIFENIDSSRTLGTALENRSYCKKPIWKEKVDDSGRKLVIFSCKINPDEINSTFERINNTFYSDFKNSLIELELEIKSIDDFIKEVNNKVVHLVENKLPEAAALLKDLQCEESGTIDERIERTDSNNKIYANIEPLINEILEESKKIKNVRNKNLVSDIATELKIKCNSGKLETIDSAKKNIATRIENYIAYQLMMLNAKQKILTLEDGLKKYKNNSINISEIHNEIIFSSNPSIENPISLKSINYSFSNNDSEYNTDAGAKIIDIYKNNEIYILKRSIGHLYMKQKDLHYIPEDLLRSK